MRNHYWLSVAAVAALALPVHAGFEGTTHMVLDDPGVDLVAAVAEYAAVLDPAPVPLGPRLVAGEGEHPDAHTVVRVFNEYQLAEHQFLAYAPDIRGGVRVAAMANASGEQYIVAVPAVDPAVREVRVFAPDGRLVSAFDAPAELAPPFVIAASDFLPSTEGMEIAIAQRAGTGEGPVLFLVDWAGNQLARFAPGDVALPVGSDTSVTAIRHESTADTLLVQAGGTGTALRVEFDRELAAAEDLGSLPGGTSVLPSAFATRDFVGVGQESVRSHLWVRNAGGWARQLVSERENAFWVVPIAPRFTDGGLVATFNGWKEGWDRIVSSAARLGIDDDNLLLTFRDQTPFDPYFYGPASEYEAGDYEYFSMRLTVRNGPVAPFQGALYFFTDEGVGRALFTVFSGTQTVRFRIPDSLAGSSVPYEGTVNTLRIDLPEGEPSYSPFQFTEISIDWLAVTDDPEFVPDQGGASFNDHVRAARYRHRRTDAASPNYRDGVDFDSEDFDDWAGGAFDDFIERQLDDYEASSDSAWNVTYSHRQFMGAFDEWVGATDPDTGMPLFLALTRLDNSTQYFEVGGGFEVMTWAPGIPAIDKLIEWPQRAFAREFVKKFRENPEKVVAFEPNHEFEVEVPDDNSIGDYNPAQVAGFREYLVRRHRTLGAINARFGTSFTSVETIDPPRNTGRGPWDSYNAGNDYLQAWVNYLRRVINYRIMQGMREALLAGFPPESIKTHQIPANYAVGPAANNGRITPIDWALTTGAGFGATRYNVWYDRASNWVQGAFSSGHSMIACGEYHPLTTNQARATDQLRYMFDNGVHFIHHMTWANEAFNDVGREAYHSLIAEDRPRPGTAGGVRSVHPVRHTHPGGAVEYDIVQLGGFEDTTGLLKSVRADGSWEGTVYLTPFHQRIGVEVIFNDASRTLSDTDLVPPPVTGLFSGDQIEVAFRARSDDPGAKMTLLATHSGMEMLGSRINFDLAQEWRTFRYTMRFQNEMEPVRLIINAGERDTATWREQTIELSGFHTTVQRRQAARIEYGIPDGTPHRGGAFVDLLSTGYRASDPAPSPFPTSSISAWQAF